MAGWQLYACQRGILLFAPVGKERGVRAAFGEPPTGGGPGGNCWAAFAGYEETVLQEYQPAALDGPETVFEVAAEDDRRKT